MTTVNEHAAPLGEILGYLDGRGLVITDDELIADALKFYNLSEESQVSWISVED